MTPLQRWLLPIAAATVLSGMAVCLVQVTTSRALHGLRPGAQWLHLLMPAAGGCLVVWQQLSGSFKTWFMPSSQPTAPAAGHEFSGSDTGNPPKVRQGGRLAPSADGFESASTNPSAWGSLRMSFLIMLAGCLTLPGLLLFVLSYSESHITVTASEQTLFQPSPVRTAAGGHIPAELLDNSDYCLNCHQDVHAGWSESAHHFSSFSNPAYLASVLETRRVMTDRDGSPQASRWCAGCHDPVLLLSGGFDRSDFDLLNDPAADSGITCTVCHAVTDVDHTRGNGGYTIEAPQHYPFANSSQPILQWINHQLIRLDPTVHKQTFLRDLHSQAEFCSACHKVHIPQALNHYRAFLRGQNHYDSWLLSGLSGHSARSFYYPERAEENCAGCHMPPVASTDAPAQQGEADDGPVIRDHMFPGANTALPWLRNSADTVATHQSFLQGAVAVDIFGIRDGERLDSPLTAPLRPQQFTLRPQNSYLLETVIRTLEIGHHFTQGTSDSNQVWLEIRITAGDQLIAASGLRGREGRVDSRAHFVNTFMLDREGHRVSRRNVQDIFVPLYDHQIPPGAAQTVHYRLTVPENVHGPLTVTARLLYRKFDTAYLEFIADTLKSTHDRKTPDDIADRLKDAGNGLPVTLLAEDTFTFAVEGASAPPPIAASPSSDWRRWNDYGIGLLLKGKAELRQAADAFRQVENLGRYDGPLNLARVLIAEGGPQPLTDAAAAVTRAAGDHNPPAPEWTRSWLEGVISRQQGDLQAAEQAFRQVLSFHTEETRRRGFDFSRDYVVNNLLGQTVFDQAVRLPASSADGRRKQRLREAVDIFDRTLQLDSENVDAHHNLAQLYQLLGEPGKAATHRKLHDRYHQDDTARGQAVLAARQRYPAAGTAAEPVVIYDLIPVPEEHR